LSSNFAKVLDHPDNIEARGHMLLGASFAGLAIENSMLGATHALANPLTSAYDIPHGQAIGVMLPHVIRFNSVQVEGWYLDLLSGCDSNGSVPRLGPGVTGLADFVTALVAKAALATTLSELGVEESRLPELAAEAARQWTGTFNPRSVGEAELLALYRGALG
jgi:alcohol dehydrogenase